MENKLYVGNLPFTITEESLSTQFSKFGTVSSAKVIIDRDTNRSKGFGFVEMSTEGEAQDAISSLDGHELEGRAMKVNLAKPQAPRNDRGNFRY
ncbi:MAG: RNA-binding protein [Peredibacter sp.]|nr:RNA-binding protein [Peredibacter sp.]